MRILFGGRRSNPEGYVAALGAVAIALAAAKSFPLLRHLPDPSLIFLTAVFASAMLGGFGPSILAVLASVFVYDYFFIDPLYTLHVSDARDLVSLVVFLIVAMVTSQMMARLREQAENAAERERLTAALYTFSRETAAAAGLDDLLPVIVRHLATVFQAEVVLSLAEDGRMVQRAGYPSDTCLPQAQRALAEQAWATGGVAGLAGTPAGAWQHISLWTSRGEAGVVSLRLARETQELSPGRQELLASLTQQAAIAIERSRIDRVLAEKTRTEHVIEASDDGIVVLDSKARVVHVNEVACAILGMDRSRLLQTSFPDLELAHPHAARLRHAVLEFFDDPDREPDRIELTVFLRGRDHHYVLRLTRYRTPGEPGPGLIIVLQDVTYVREQEARRENLIATLSHELRTPLTSLRMAVERLQRGAMVLGEDGRQCVDTAFEDVMRLQDVAQQFLDLARTGAMAIGVEHRPVDVRELVASVGRMFALQAKERSVSLDCNAVPGISLMGDETKLSWALSNLVGNAIRYTPAGGHVHVTAQSSDHKLLLSVSDEGRGIPAEQRERVFDRFVQGAGQAEMGAAGLGLSIVRDIVEAHRGRVHLDSIVGRGSCFTLELPLD